MAHILFDTTTATASVVHNQPINTITFNIRVHITITMTKFLNIAAFLAAIVLSLALAQQNQVENFPLSANSPVDCESIIETHKFEGTCCALNATAGNGCVLNVADGNCIVSSI